MYDIWGNLTNMNPVAGKTYYQNLQAAPASVKNQLTGFSYDAAGNMTADGVHTYAWGAENRMQSLDAGAATYVYTPDGERVKKRVSGTATQFISGSGSVLEEVTNGAWTKDYIYLGGELLATESATQGTRYHFSDHLGTPRLVTSPAGAVVCRHDYYPYGKEVGACSDGETHKFTSKERDAESGLDYFGARHFGSSLEDFCARMIRSLTRRRMIPRAGISIVISAITRWRTPTRPARPARRTRRTVQPTMMGAGRAATS